MAKEEGTSPSLIKSQALLQTIELGSMVQSFWEEMLKVKLGLSEVIQQQEAAALPKNHSERQARKEIKLVPIIFGMPLDNTFKDS
jgi:hypothetical protein